MEKPLWTTWAQFKCDISHDVVSQYLRDLNAHGFSCNLLGIDARWQAEMGDSTFNPQTFPAPSALVQDAAQYGAKLTVWTAPYIEPQSANYAEGVEDGHYVKQADGTPALLNWWGGAGGFVNPASETALDWYFSAFQRDLVAPFGIHGIKVDGGEALFFLQGGYANVDGVSLNELNHRYVKHAAECFPWSDTRSGWKNQGDQALFRQWDKSSTWGFDNGLASCITQAIMLNLVGYPYSFPDMIGGNMYDHGPLEASAELIIRWTQAVAPMPLIQFSLSPWEYGDECASLCARYARLHEELAPLRMALAKAHTPIVRPLWWIAPHDVDALTIDDEHLVGNDLLVAPVIHPGERVRDLYLPAGTWCSYWDHAEVHNGGTWLTDYPATLDTLPLFTRLSAG
jgi:alpha-glucosidase (family GH31 glycosyl hydrolase)